MQKTLRKEYLQKNMHQHKNPEYGDQPLQLHAKESNQVGGKVHLNIRQPRENNDRKPNI